jgi:predicted transposase/invertase (TIGR01784 family)
MILGVRPTVDFAFKRVFGHERTIPILMNLIDSVLDPPPEHRLDKLEVLNPFNLKETVDDKESILDIKARDQSGRQFNVEMQVIAHPHFDKRIVYYASRLHQQQLYQGEEYEELRPTISINFVDDVLFAQSSDNHLVFQLLEQRHGFRLSDDLEVHILELPKFAKAISGLETDLDVWLYFLRNAEKMDIDNLSQAFAERPLVCRALEELKMLTQSEIEREHYEARLKSQLDKNNILRAVQKANESREQARKEGLQEGRQEGREEARPGLIGAIHFCEQLLRRSPTPAEQLSQWSIDELSQFAAELQAEVLHQHGDAATA